MQYHGSFNDKTIDIDDSFTFDDASTTYSCNGKSFNSDDTELTEAFKTFYTALSEISYESLDTSAQAPTDTEPALHLEYTMLDGSTHVVDLVKKDDTTYWVFIDGEFTHAVVRQRALSGEDKVLGNLHCIPEASGICCGVNAALNHCIFLCGDATVLWHLRFCGERRVAADLTPQFQL